MISVYCVSLGCAKNRIDTEMILASFPQTARLVDSPEQADLILINTCAFIADAKKESILKTSSERPQSGPVIPLSSK